MIRVRSHGHVTVVRVEDDGSLHTDNEPELLSAFIEDEEALQTYRATQQFGYGERESGETERDTAATGRTTQCTHAGPPQRIGTKNGAAPLQPVRATLTKPCDDSVRNNCHTVVARGSWDLCGTGVFSSHTRLTTARQPRQSQLLPNFVWLLVGTGTSFYK